MRWLIVAGLLSSGVLAVTTLTASASATGTCAPAGGAWASEVSAGASLECPTGQLTDQPTSPAKGRSGRSVTKPACVWVPKPDYHPSPGEKTDGDGGHWYTKFCSFGEYQSLSDFEREMSAWDAMNTRQTEMMRRAGLETRFFTTPPPVQLPTPEQVMASIVDNLPIPATFVAVNPVAAKQVVGVPTWVWLTDENGKYVTKRYGPEPKEIVLDGYALKWQIVPQLTVSPGAGQEQSCNGAGVPWSPNAEGDTGACTVVYEKAGKYKLSANVGWTVRWWLAGAPQPDIAGPTNTATKALTVLEIQAVGN